MANDQWYYAHDGERVGPVPFSAVVAMAGAGTLKPQDLVWNEGMADWSPAANIPNLFVQPFHPTAHVSPLATSKAFAPIPYVPNSFVADPRINYYSQPQSPIRYAGFWLRAVAMMLDMIFLLIVSGILVGVFSMGSSVGARTSITSTAYYDTVSASLNVYSILIFWLYDAFMESSSMQGSLGKIAMGLKVTTLDSHRISFGRATFRHFGKFLSGFLLVGFLMAAFTDRKQALHDLIASCLVVRK